VKRLTIAAAAVAFTIAAAGSAAAQTTTTTPPATPATTTAPGAAPAPTAAPAGATRGVTDTSIRVGGLGYSSVYGGADVGARARFQRANDAGGVNGRKIDYLALTDDGGDPATGSAAAKKLVEQDGVFAVVPTVTPDLAASTYLVQQKVPYFGWALSSNFCGTRYGFGFSGCPFPKNATSNAWPLLISKMLPTGATGRAVAIVAENTPSGQYEVDALSAAAKSVKFRIAYAKTSLATPATPDYNAVAKEVMTSNKGNIPDAVFVLGGASNVLGMQQALAGNGFLGLFTNQLEYAPHLVAPSASAIVLTQTAPSETAGDNPAMKQLVDDVQKVAPGQAIDQSVLAGYWSADLFLAAVQKAGKRLTTASLEKAANSKFTYQVPNTVGPTVFPAAHSLPTPCGALVSSNGTAYVVKVPYTCGRVVPIG
jgi:ABC-type branched-subunit amino acid transport system substrate-binding protein